jgi:hypothetical protein
VDKSERALAQASAALGAAAASNNQPSMSSGLNAAASSEPVADGLPPKKKVCSILSLAFVKADLSSSDGSQMPNKAEFALHVVETTLLNGER